VRRIPRASLIFLSLALAAQFFLAGTTPAQNCGGTERWGPKDGTDPQALNIDLTNITPEVVADLVTIHQPQLPGDNKTRIVPDETHVYLVLLQPQFS